MHNHAYDNDHAQGPENTQGPILLKISYILPVLTEFSPHIDNLGHLTACQNVGYVNTK